MGFRSASFQEVCFYQVYVRIRSGVHVFVPGSTGRYDCCDDTAAVAAAVLCFFAWFFTAACAAAAPVLLVVVTGNHGPKIKRHLL